MLKLVQPVSDATTEIVRRLVEMHEFVAYGVVDVRFLFLGEPTSGSLICEIRRSAFLDAALEQLLL